MIKINKMNYKCPCCNYLTFGDDPDSSYEICPICYWEGDPVQNNDHTYEAGANIVSLNVAKDNFKKFGAIHNKFKLIVRLPLENEKP